jgi:hypothetical protein
LSFQDDKDRRRKAEPQRESETEHVATSKKKRGGSPEIGHALRSAYQQAVSETIPPEMLDLLGKLG